MHKKIENLTKNVVTLRLNSGLIVRIAPGASSEEILGVELNNNGQIKRLEERGIIAVHPVGKKVSKNSKKESPGSGPTPGAASSREKPGLEKKDKRQTKAKGGK